MTDKTVSDISNRLDRYINALETYGVEQVEIPRVLGTLRNFVKEYRETLYRIESSATKEEESMYDRLMRSAENHNFWRNLLPKNSH